MLVFKTNSYTQKAICFLTKTGKNLKVQIKSYQDYGIFSIIWPSLLVLQNLHFYNGAINKAVHKHPLAPYLHGFQNAHRKQARVNSGLIKTKEIGISFLLRLKRYFFTH